MRRIYRIQRCQFDKSSLFAVISGRQSQRNFGELGGTQGNYFSGTGYLGEMRAISLAVRLVLP